MKLNKFAILTAVSLVVACASENQNQNQTNTNSTQSKVVEKEPFHINFLLDKQENVIGEKFDIKVEKDSSLNIDSFRVFLDNKEIETIKDTDTYTVDTKDMRCGDLAFRLEVYSNQKTYYYSKKQVFLSDVTPKKLSYKVKKTYKHDKNAYTQGLIYQDGYFWESTGLRGQSSLRKTKIEGEVLQSISLENQYFGEGIALLPDNKIAQLTWQSQKGFVYDRQTFEKVQEFFIPTEGWGLEFYNNELILSDGSENLYFLDPKTFAILRTIQVYDNKNFVDNLNELEVIDDMLYANIYMTDQIAIIDIKTGKITAYIDFTGLLPSQDYSENTNVLNGIAYDKQNKRIFVTGKNWPKLFEVEIK